MLDHQNHKENKIIHYTRILDAQRFHTTLLRYYRLMNIGLKFLVIFQYHFVIYLKRKGKHLLFKQ